MKTHYRVLAKFYDLIDVFYFNRPNFSPRNAMMNFIASDIRNVLDICTGTASNSISIAKVRKNTEITGIDLSKEMLAIAAEKIEQDKLHNLKTKVMDATNMSFNAESFDIVLISLVLHEVDEKIRESVLLEAKRVLRENGRIIIVEWDSPKRLYQRLMFLPIRLLEPRGFREFLRLNLKEYFGKYGLMQLSEIKCDYTKVIELTK